MVETTGVTRRRTDSADWSYNKEVAAHPAITRPPGAEHRLIFIRDLEFPRFAI
jgi:hypothetical protein